MVTTVPTKYKPWQYHTLDEGEMGNGDEQSGRSFPEYNIEEGSFPPSLLQVLYPRQLALGNPLHCSHHWQAAFVAFKYREITALDAGVGLWRKTPGV